jgi:hypothetical protein
MFDSVRAFEMKLEIFRKELEKLTHAIVLLIIAP